MRDAFKKGLRTPEFVGREEARRDLDAALDRAVRFTAPQVATLLGPVGVGKSRLLDEWTERVEEAGVFRCVRVAVAASPLEAEPLSILPALLRARFGLGGGEDPEQALEVFQAELRRVFGDRRVGEVAGVLGRSLGLPIPESPLGQALASRPEQESDLARAVLCRFLEEDARAQPLLLLLDDLQKCDDLSLDLLEHLAGEVGATPLVIVAAARPDLLVRKPGWGRGGGSHVRLDLAPLSRLELDVLLRSALDSEVLPHGLADTLAAVSGGNPYLVDRILHALVEHGALQAGDEGWRFDRERATRIQSSRLGVAPEALVQGRVAALAPAERELLARAAAFGPVFWTGGVVALGRVGVEPPDATAVFAPDPAIATVAATLERLAAAELVVAVPASTLPGEAEWVFCHSEERALLLAGLDPELVSRWRRFAAQWLEARPRARASADRFERLGELYEAGGEPRRAAAAFTAGGDAALRRMRHERARALYLRASRLLGLDDAVAKLDLGHKLGDVAVRLGRIEEALAHFQEMLCLAWRLDVPAKGGAAHARIGRLHRALGDLARAQEHLDLAHLLFDLSGDRRGIASTLDDIGRVNLLRGNLEEAATFHRAALAIREELSDGRGRALTLSWMGLVELQRANLSTAASCCASSLALARAARDGHGIVFSLIDLGRLAREAGDHEVAVARLEEARRLATELAERLYQCHVGVELGETRLQQGQLELAEQELRTALATAQKFGARRLAAEARRALGEVRLRAGDLRGARDEAYEALTMAERMGLQPLRASALRVMATAVSRGAPGESEHGGAREMFDRAVELLSGKGADLELRRVLLAYAEHEQVTGRDEAADELRVQAAAIRARMGGLPSDLAGLGEAPAPETLAPAPL